MEEQLEEQMNKLKDEFKEPEQLSADELENLPSGDISVHKVDYESDKKVDIFAFPDPETGDMKRYDIEHRRLPYENQMRLMQKSWKDSGHDQKLFTALYQIEQMKACIRTVNGKAIGKQFWIEIGSEWADGLRQVMFGDHSLNQPFDEDMLKNLIVALPQLMTAMRNSEGSKNPDEKPIVEAKVIPNSDQDDLSIDQMTQS